jgi:DNA polymerase-1
MIQCDDLIEKNALFKDTRLLLQIHDELVFEIDNEHLDEVVAIIAHTMENVVSLNVEFPVKVYAKCIHLYLIVLDHWELS